MEEYLEFLSVRCENEFTRKSYITSIDNFLKFFDIKSVEEMEKISPSKIREWQNELKKTLSRASVNARVRPVKSFYGWLWKQEYIQNNPMLKIERLKEEKKEPYIPSDEEYQCALAACQNAQEELTLRIPFEMGLRVSEMCQARKSHIHGEYLTVKGKGGVVADVFINARIRELIETVDGDSIIHRHNKEITTVAAWKRFKTIFKRSGFSDEQVENIHPHTGRHWFVSSVIEKTGDISTAQRAARHQNIGVTQRYAHMKKGQLAKAMNTISGIGG